MTLWKQRLLSRYHKPADGEGGDLGGGEAAATSATESALDAVGATDDAAEQPAGDDAPSGDGEQPAGDEQPAKSSLSALLDGLTDGAEPKKPEGEQPAAAAKPEDGKAKPEDKPEDKPAADKEEAELLEGVKSERGKERVRQVFQENKTLKSEIEGFKTLVQSTGMSAEQFAQTLEFGRLVSSGDPENLQLAVQMIEKQRADIYAMLGKEAPGVDLLAEFPDLKKRVDDMDMTRDAAVELAKHRRKEKQEQAARQQTQEREQSLQTMQQTVSAAAAQMDTYLQTRAKEVDHPARMAALAAKFKDPAFMQEFVQTYKPEQWVTTIKVMYDGIQVPKAQQRHDPGQQPLRSRSRPQGNPVPAGATPMDRMAGHLENLGL